MKLTGETEVLGGKNLSQCHFVHHKSHMDWPGIEQNCSYLWQSSRYCTFLHFTCVISVSEMLAAELLTI
jgi:hypothetical protein